MGTKALAVLDIASGIFNDEGNPVAGGKIYFYEAGTLTLKDIYLDRNKTTPSSNPVILDIYGRAEIYGDGLYKMKVTDADDVTLWDLDNVELVPLEGGTYDGVTINPSTAAPVTGSLLKFTVSLEDSNGDTITEFSEIAPYIDTAYWESTFDDTVDYDAGVSVKDPVYWDSASSTWKKADLTGNDPEAFCVTHSDDGDGTYSGKLVYNGIAAGLSGLSNGTEYYLNTTGGLTAAETAWYIGKAISTTKIIINPRKTSAGTGSGSVDVSQVLEIISEARKRGLDIPIPIIDYVLEAAEKARVTIPLQTSYTGGTTVLKLTQKIFIEDGNYVPIFITDDTSENYDLIWLDSLTGETVGEYTYSLVDSITNSYTTANSSYVTNSTGVFKSNQIQHNPDVSGGGETDLNADTLLFSYVRKKQIGIASYELLQRIYDNGYFADLSAYAATKTISFEAPSDISGEYKNNNYIALIHSLEEDNDEVAYPYKELRQYRGEQARSWYIFQLDANGTYSSPAVSVTVDQALDLATGTFTTTLPTFTDTSNWKVVRLPGLLSYLAGAKTASTFTQAVPSELIVSQGIGTAFKDEFSRTTTSPTIGGSWLGGPIGISGPGTCNCDGTRFRWSEANHNGDVIGNHYVPLPASKNYKVQWVFQLVHASHSYHTSIAINLSKTATGFYNNSDSVASAYFDWIGTSVNTSIAYLYSGGALKSQTSVTRATVYYATLEQKNNTAKLQLRATSHDSAVLYELELTSLTGLDAAKYLIFEVSATGTADTSYIDEVVVTGDESYTLKYKVENLNNIEKYGLYIPNNRGVNTATPIIYNAGGALVE